MADRAVRTNTQEDCKVQSEHCKLGIDLASFLGQFAICISQFAICNHRPHALMVALTRIATPVSARRKGFWNLNQFPRGRYVFVRLDETEAAVLSSGGTGTPPQCI